MPLALTRDHRICGCLLAGACGDALGVPVEFMRLTGIRARYGEHGIRDLGPGAKQITADTQMTLFTAEGLIRAALAASDFPDGLRLAANHSGDIGSTAAIAGNLLGTLTRGGRHTSEMA